MRGGGASKNIEGLVRRGRSKCVVRSDVERIMLEVRRHTEAHLGTEAPSRINVRNVIAHAKESMVRWAEYVMRFVVE
ncbi:hypothetical protein V3C99_012114 [Haemonchus contortus]|uniref:DUF4145 domain-containing protein n=1 Tax=Haemonchus contortus TaxID=6289 RepID=A0A7I4Y680_HAECO|nr:unnamed protein product [Haemonchus contortus]